MTKFSLLVVIVTIAIGYYNVAESIDIAHSDDKVDDKTEDDSSSDPNDPRRSGAYAYAKMSVSKQQHYGPTPMLVSPPNVGRSLPNEYGFVECYTCTNCETVLPNTTTKWCPKTFDRGIRTACVSYAEQFRYMKNTFHIRGCASERGACADIRENHNKHQEIVKLLYCNECEGNRCNGADRSFVDLSMAIITLLITPLVAKWTMS
ncbi:uncharacterized protein LOC126374093 [Pectinophora gossypiella]|uniref:Protein sleepless n=1 Tax=Pectinophora gossypiella TaxID=13191 RepID=A0A1E1WNM9_PECGO|nr:uncharacterized protein LOC126374093 [Pectinophora gossypiella]